MKTIFTLLMSLLMTFAIAQNHMFVHTATAGNIQLDLTVIDHPDLNGNATAKLLITHNWNPGGSGGTWNDNTTGAFYDGAQWGIYNENQTGMTVGSSYNVYIAQGLEVVLHIADLANQGTNDAYSVINHPDLNANPNARILLTTYYNPNSLRNDHNYGVWYNDTLDRWMIYSEDLTTIPLDTAFFVGIASTLAHYSTHTATAGNTSFNFTMIDDALLNNNPNGVLVVTHNWGTSGNPSNVVLDKTLGVWYDGSNWGIFTEDSSTMPVDVQFDMAIFDPALGVSDPVSLEVITAPNPTRGMITISSQQEIDIVRLYNILGQEIKTVYGNDTNVSIDLSEFAAGQYIAMVQAGNSNESIKIIKQ